MVVPSRRQHEDNQSGDERTNVHESESSARMLEYYIVAHNRKLENLIAEHDPHSTIDLSCQKLTDHDMAIVIKYAILGKKCKGLNLWGNRFSSESITILANVLSDNQTLEELDLSRAHILDDGVKILSESLSLNTCLLKEIDLSSNGITDIGANYLSNMLERNQELKVLTLDDNEITNQGLVSIANGLIDRNKKLRDLKLQWNTKITKAGVDRVINLLKDNQTLQYLYLKRCNILKDDFTELEEAAFRSGFDVIL